MKVPDQLGSVYYRSFLSSQGQRCYDIINAQFLQGDFSGKTSVPISDHSKAASDCFAAYKAIRDDHPEYFFLGFQSEFTSSRYEGVLTYPILYSEVDIRRIQLQMRTSIYRIVRGNAYLPLIEQEILVYERIARKLKYINHSDVLDHNVVGPILISSGVCEGHNALLLLCFRRLGIPCIKVYGKTKSDNWHCWTIAWIYGIPTHCDVTWDGTEDGFVCFNYLNLSDSQISSDHFDFHSANIPVCVSESLNYYRYRKLIVDSFESLRTHIRTTLSMDNSVSLLHFDYVPENGNYFEEVRKAIAIERIGNSHRLFFNESHRNMALLKIS